MSEFDLGVSFYSSASEFRSLDGNLKTAIGETNHDYVSSLFQNCQKCGQTFNYYPSSNMTQDSKAFSIASLYGVDLKVQSEKG